MIIVNLKDWVAGLDVPAGEKKRIQRRCEFGYVATFEGLDGPRLVRVTGCDNPDCPCRDLGVRVLEIDAGRSTCSFNVSVDTWKPTDLHESGANTEAGRIAEEFVRDLPAGIRSDWKETFEKKRQEERNKRSFAITPKEIRSGRLVSWVELVEGSPSVMDGGRVALFSLEHLGEKWVVEDRYCSNPDCGCNETLLYFLRLRGDEFSGAFDVWLPHKGNWDSPKIETVKLGRDEALEVLGVWRKKTPGARELLRHRHREVHVASRRVLKKEKVGTPGIRRRGRAKIQPVGTGRGAHEMRSNVSNEKADSVDRKVGRNAPCPCGSGKKYKRCCLGKS